ncbi:hypothetical protein [Alteriqipengyuania sp.]|uniref:hypothetical protein n=1 Tax=Alteriqipengyuania sp. TaxID=2800692 RepID=UPI003517CA43
MTALSLNLTPAHSIDIAGLPLEGLPPLEAGRTLPQAFAELLNNSGQSADQTPVDGEGEGIGTKVDGSETGQAIAPEGQALANVVKPQVTSVGRQPIGSKAEAPDNEPAETGKTLPPARPEIAAMRSPVPGSKPGADFQTGEAQSDPATKDSAAGAPRPIEPDTVPLGAKEAGPEVATKTVTVASDTLLVASAGIAASQAGVAADLTAQAKGPARSIASGASAAQPTVAGAAVPGIVTPGADQDFSNAQQGGSNGGQSEQRAAHSGAVQSRTIATTQDAALPSTPLQGTGSSGNAPASPAPQAAVPQGALAQAASTQEAAQTGISLQLRAADKPVADIASPASASTLSSVSTSLVATSFGSQPAAASFAAAPQAAMAPQFTELAALVDRIEAARASTGNASATIALAHKELGNLALTFETSGRTLAVEVAAQDSETQRSLAAAIANDRPQLRTAETQAQAPSLQNQLASSAHGGSGGDARGSAMAGDAQSDRRGDPRNTGRQGGSGESQARPDPKSDGGIYA